VKQVALRAYTKDKKFQSFSNCGKTFLVLRIKRIIN
jgi:hypothetical protein